MLQYLTRALCAVFFIALASPSFALVSICSGEFLPQVGADAVRHEVLWDDFDAWFADADVEMYTLVNGAATLEWDDVYEIGQGGSAAHVAPIQTEGKYTVSGYVRLAYPQAWGIDGGFGSACDPWSGALNQTLADNASGSADNVAQDGGTTDSQACLATTTDGCMSDGSTPPVIGGKDSDVTASRPPASRIEQLGATRGLLYALDEKGLVLQTPTGYRTYYFVQPYSISRHTVVQVSELKPGDVISAITERNVEGALDVVGLRVYRDQPRDATEVQMEPSSAAELANEIVVSGVVKELSVQQGRGGTLRIASSDREQVLEVSPLIDATVIRPAAFADISEVHGYINVTAAQQDDGSLAVRALELHW